MKCSEALTILSHLTQRQVTAHPQHLQELCRAELVFEIDPALLELADAFIWAIDAFGMSSAPPHSLLDPSWLQIRLDEIEGKLTSGFSRGFSRKATIWSWEQRRAKLRALIGALSYSHVHEAFMRAVRIKPLLGPTPMLAVAADQRVYAIALRGHRLLGALSVRQARYQNEALHTFMKRFMKSEMQIRRLKDAATVIDMGIGEVPKARGQIIIGLIKSGLAPDDAVRTYQQGKDLANWVPYKEQPAMAVNYVRGAPQLGGPQRVASKMAELMRLVQRAGLGGGADGDKRIARALLGVPNPAAGLERAKELLWTLQHTSPRYDGDVFKATARLLSTPGTPKELAIRLAFITNALRKRQPSHFVIHRDDAALSLAAAMTQSGAEQAVVERFLAIYAELERQRIPPGTNIHELAALLAPHPGTPTELVHTLSTAAISVSNESTPTPADYAFAASFIKRFLY